MGPRHFAYLWPTVIVGLARITDLSAYRKGLSLEEEFPARANERVKSKGPKVKNLLTQNYCYVFHMKDLDCPISS